MAATALVGSHVQAQQASEETRKAFLAAVEANPSQKVTRIEKRCLDGTEPDASDCEGLLLSRLSLRAAESRLAATESRLAAAESKEFVLQTLGLTLALVQLVNYVELDEPKPEGNAGIRNVLADEKTSVSIKQLLSVPIQRKESGKKGFSEAEVSEILRQLHLTLATAKAEIDSERAKAADFTSIKKMISILEPATAAIKTTLTQRYVK